MQKLAFRNTYIYTASKNLGNYDSRNRILYIILPNALSVRIGIVISAIDYVFPNISHVIFYSAELRVLSRPRADLRCNLCNAKVARRFFSRILNAAP